MGGNINRPAARLVQNNINSEEFACNYSLVFIKLIYKNKGKFLKKHKMEEMQGRGWLQPTTTGFNITSS